MELLQKHDEKGNVGTIGHLHNRNASPTKRVIHGSGGVDQKVEILTSVPLTVSEGHTNCQLNASSLLTGTSGLKLAIFPLSIPFQIRHQHGCSSCPAECAAGRSPSPEHEQKRQFER